MVSKPQPGTMVTPNVRLVRPLGAGGMGAVWVAEHLALKTQVVVKFMAAELAANEEAIARFSREAAAAAQVKSPHVVQVFDHGVRDGLPYIVMELLEGRDLAAFIGNGPLPPQMVVEIVGQIAKALGKAHAAGIVHRDIKPENIFLCDVEGGEVFVKLLDFGIAKASSHKLGSGTRTGQVVGTPYYMCPEQIVGAKNVDLRADLWSLGVVVFEALTGMRPFEGETVGALTLSIHGATPSLTAVNPALPPEVDAWFRKACAKEPESRFASAKDLAQALSQALGQAGPSAREASDVRAFVPTPAAPSGGARVDAQAATALGASVLARPKERSGAKLVVLGAVGLVVFGIAAVAAIKLSGPKPAPAGAPPTGLSVTESTTATTTTTTTTTSPSPSPSASVATAPTSTPNAPASSTGRPFVHAPRPSATLVKSVSPPPTASIPKPKPTSNEDDIK
jgi:serine/threonine-protein kinase